MMKHQEDEEHEEDKLQDEWRSEEEEERFHVAPNMKAGDSHLQATLDQEEEEERQEKEQLEEDRKACV